VITGSFNFTKAAQYRNAENLLIIVNDVLAKKYLDNWNDRYSQSVALEQYRVQAQYKAMLKARRLGSRKFRFHSIAG
jgi:phosphatidylserine/phosphatidylglycerophosphate/cardiolipin synthase-like enzyme